MLKKVILISGKARSGKDTVANMLKTYFQGKGERVLIMSFAGYLKFMCKEYFGWNGEKDEQGRTILQYVGTDLVRANHPDFWLNIILETLLVIENEFDYVIIPDTRFKNEFEFGYGRSLWNVYTIRTNRYNFVSPLTEKQQKHISETELDETWHDWHINAGTLSELKDSVNLLTKEIYE